MKIFIKLLPPLILLFFLSNQVFSQSQKLWKEADPQQQNQPLISLPSLSVIVKKIKPSVVSFYIVSKVASMEGDPLYKFFHEYFKGFKKHWTRKGIGSGVIINEKGYILTNSHIFEGVKSLKVILTNGEVCGGKIIGKDDATDIALVKVKSSSKLKPAVLGDSDVVETGDWVIAIGSPFGLETTVTVGIVSAIERNRVGPPSVLEYQNLIQTDAPINPGNSGGPLIDLSGNVIGITTAITSTGQGIGFAIPINMAKEILPQLYTKGRVLRSWLGVTVQKLNKPLAESFGARSPGGALVVEVHKNSPAYFAGVKIGDIILEFNGEKISTPEKLSWLAANSGAGKSVNLKILRRFKVVKIKVTLDYIPGTKHHQETSRDAFGSVTDKKIKKTRSSQPDIKVSPIDKYTAQKLELVTAEGGVVGVVVTSIDEDSPFKKAGLSVGDIVVEVNGKKCFGKNSFYNVIKSVKKGKIIRMYIISKKKKGFIAFRK